MDRLATRPLTGVCVIVYCPPMRTRAGGLPKRRDLGRIRQVILVDHGRLERIRRLTLEEPGHLLDLLWLPRDPAVPERA